MNKEAIFDKQGFMSYMEEHFPSAFCGLDGGFLRETVENIIDYGLQNKTASKDQLVLFLSDLLPAEVELAEIAMHVREDCLTSGMQELIEEWKDLNA